MSSDQAPAFIGHVKDLVKLARAVSPEILIDKLGPYVLVGPSSAFADDKPTRDTRDGWTFETKMTGGSPAAMLTDSFESHEVYALKKSRTFFRKVIMVGRAASNDVVIEGPSISKLHARLKPLPEGGFLISDAGSKYGTFVGSDRLGENEEREIGHGDHIRFGNRPFKLFETERFHKLLVRTTLLPT